MPPKVFAVWRNKAYNDDCDAPEDYFWQEKDAAQLAEDKNREILADYEAAYRRGHPVPESMKSFYAYGEIEIK